MTAATKCPLCEHEGPIAPLLLGFMAALQEAYARGYNDAHAMATAMPQETPETARQGTDSNQARGG